MSGTRKVLECKITVEGVSLPIDIITEALTKEGYDTIERPLGFDNNRNLGEVEIEVYKTVKPVEDKWGSY